MRLAGAASLDVCPLQSRVRVPDPICLATILNTYKSKHACVLYTFFCIYIYQLCYSNSPTGETIAEWYKVVESDRSATWFETVCAARRASVRFRRFAY